MTSFLQNYIQGAKVEFANGRYENSKRYIQRALEWGARRYWEYEVDFHEWFDLQLRLAEIYEKEGHFQDAQNHVTFIRRSSSSSSSATNTLDYRKISELQGVQLRCAAARLCLRAYEQGDNTILDKLIQEALAAYEAATSAFPYVYDYNGESDVALQDLLVESAVTLDKAYGILGDPVGRRSLREQLCALDPINHFGLVTALDAASSTPVPNPPSTCGSSEAQSLVAVSTPITASTSRDGNENFRESPSRFMGALCDDAFGTEETNSIGQAILLTAAKNHDYQQLKEICRLEFGLNINAVDNTGMNALHHALTTIGGEEIVKLLIDKGIDVNASDSRGDTPLHYCVKRDNWKAAKFLLRTHKVVIESVNKANKTAAQLAISQSGGMLNIDMLKLLIRYKANFDWPGIPRGIRNELRMLGYGSPFPRGSLEVPAVTDRIATQDERQRDNRSSISSLSSQHGRWTQLIATISQSNS